MLLVKLPEPKKWLWLLLYGIAMGVLEAAVVVYLRELYYPQGFGFPMTAIPVRILGVELCRELATLVMLASLAWIAGKTIAQRLAWFLYSFAIWDLCYYLFLYIFLGWPTSLFTWDLLFLIPVAWTSPVLAPVIVSITFVVLALGIIVIEYRYLHPIPRLSWLLLVAGAVVLFISFVYDYSAFMLRHIHFFDFWNPAKTNLIIQYSMEYVPRSYNWLMFAVGEILLLGSLLVYRFRR
ncbi:MAG: hypothetical protein ACP5PZ_05665 [Bacteroidales bacterium]